MSKNNSDAIGTLRWQGIDGVVIPSEEGYGVIFTADPERMVITVPFEMVKDVTNDMSEAEVKQELEPMFHYVVHMLEEMESRDPE